MIWEFTLIENFYDSRETVIDEPIGWDALSMVLMRDIDWHGANPQFGDNSLQFGNTAYWILKDEYERALKEGDVGIRIRWKCDDCRAFKLFFEGQIDFGRYDERCEEDCYVFAGIEDRSPLTMLKNRGETDVDLTSNLAYDGTTTLTDYTGLNKEITLPSKALHLKGSAKCNNAGDDTDAYNLLADFDFEGLEEGAFKYVIIPKLNQVDINEIADFKPSYAFDLLRYTGSEPAGELDGHEIADIQPSSLGSVTNTYDVSYRQKGTLYLKYNSSILAPSITFISLDLKLGAKYSNGGIKTDAFAPISLGTYSGNSTNNTPEEHTINFDQSGIFSVDLADADKLWFYLMLELTMATEPDVYPYVDLNITSDNDSSFDIETASYAPDSPCKTFMLHEAASRVIEHITNNTLKFKSDYYGRIDSEPYAYDVDGCGGLRTITNGLKIRRAVLQDDSEPKVFTNWKVLLSSLNACDLIGYGMEGNDVRVEPIRYFYRDTVVFVADGVNSYSRKIKNDRIWNQFSFGYEKFETESTNGLDAFHTKRQYRLPLQNADTPLEKICKYILDGYAEEVTRRKFGTTQDWRYDQDIFMLCLKRGETDVEVEQGNIDSPVNMFDPPTVINYRLSPIRNAMRWFSWIAQGIKQIDPANTKILFNSGVGNYVAEGKLQGSDCVLEANAIAENAPLFQNQFEDISEGTPIILPEDVTFTFPLGLNEFLFLKQNFYGLIQYRRYETDDWKFGWITKLEPRHEEGEAKFTLVSALGGTPVNTENYIITETGIVITNEDGNPWITEN